MFFLLATFVMVSTSMIKNRGIAVNLPRAESGTSQERKDFVSLSVASTGEYFLDKRKLSREELRGALESLKATNSDPHVFINGDEAASVGSLVGALDEVRKVGINKVALETESSPNP
jgi:biopolymer transport protein ExbD